MAIAVDVPYVRATFRFRPPRKAKNIVLKRFFSRSIEHPAPKTAPGTRLYAIGDVHGCVEQLSDLIQQIEADEAARTAMPTTLVFLGDLVDRGPHSREVVELVRDLAARRPCVVLKGNHEEILLTARAGDRSALMLFNRVGGRETMLSYNVDADTYDHADIDALCGLVRDYVPQDHADYLESFVDHHVSGDYWFVHAGVRHGYALQDQTTSDLRWIREPFLSSDQHYGGMVIHGHTITRDVEFRPNRIGIDTGAYATGRLSALRLEGNDQEVIQTG